MAYATLEDMVSRFEPRPMADLLNVEEEDLEEGAAGYDEAVAALRPVLDDVSSDIDSRLARAYDLPLPDGTYPFLVAVACDLARYGLYAGEVPEVVSTRARNAGTRLRQLVDGARDLVNSAGVRIERRQSAKIEAAAVSTGDTRGPDRRQEAADTRRYF